MKTRDGLVKSARIVVRVALWANRIFLGAVVVGLALTFIFAVPFERMLAQSLPGANIAEAAAGGRWTMALGILMALATDRLLVALAAMIETAGAGDPFIAANVSRLHRIGWCLLALQLCEIPGTLIARAFPAMGPAAPGGDVSIAGWISVLMVFVLARIFAAGAAMRDDLEGTI